MVRKSVLLETDEAKQLIRPFQICLRSNFTTLINVESQNEMCRLSECSRTIKTRHNNSGFPYHSHFSYQKINDGK